jgi:hypothetical protein
MPINTTTITMTMLEELSSSDLLEFWDVVIIKLELDSSEFVP